MTHDEMLSVALKLRKQGAKRIELAPDGGMVVEFEGLPPLKSRTRAVSGVVNDPAQAEFGDAIMREPKLTEAQLERLLDKAREEYIP